MQLPFGLAEIGAAIIVAHHRHEPSAVIAKLHVKRGVAIKAAFYPRQNVIINCRADIVAIAAAGLKLIKCHLTGSQILAERIARRTSNKVNSTRL